MNATPAALDATQRAILAAVTTSPRTARQITAAARVTGSDTARTLPTLVESGLIIPVGDDDADAYRLPFPAPTAASNPTAAALAHLARTTGATPGDRFGGDRYVIAVDADTTVTPDGLTVRGVPAPAVTLTPGFYALLITAAGAYAWEYPFRIDLEAASAAEDLREW